MKLFAIRDKNNTEEARYWSSTEGFVEQEKADVFYEDNLLKLNTVGTELEEVTVYKYLPIQVDIQNEDDTSHRLVKTSDEGRVYVRVGKVDIAIKQSEDGQGIIIDAFDRATGMQDLGKITISYDDVEEESEHLEDTINA